MRLRMSTPMSSGSVGACRVGRVGNGRAWEKRRRQLRSVALGGTDALVERQLVHLTCRFRKEVHRRVRMRYCDDCSRNYNSGPLGTSFDKCGRSMIVREGKREYIVLHAVAAARRLHVRCRPDWMLRMALLGHAVPHWLQRGGPHLSGAAAEYARICAQARLIEQHLDTEMIGCRGVADIPRAVASYL